MNLILKRKYFKETYTIGDLLIDGVFFSNTLEDKFRSLPEEQKIYGQTAIPFGTYRVIMSFSPKMGRVMPELLNVPYFEAIRIHSGNTSVDTEGCILVGKNDNIGVVSNSRAASDKLNLLIADALTKGNVYIDVIKG